VTIALIAIDVAAYVLSSRHTGLLPFLLDILLLALLGRSVEGSLGRARMCAFCLLGGLLAPAARAVTDAGSPSLLLFSASGMIAAVLGGYLPLHPRARVLTLIVVPFFTTIVEIPAVLLLGLWFLLQLYFGAAGLAGQIGGGSVAWFVHVVGFVLGLALIGRFVKHRASTPPPHPVYQRR
jgi:membrane associated rhomboid family serine protease